MRQIIKKIIRKTRQLGAFIVIIATSCTTCPKEEIDAIIASIPNPETKIHGVDLRGWTYEKVTSEKSGETYYYYHMASKKKDAMPFVLVHGMFLDARTFLNFGPLADQFELFALELPHDSMYYTGNSGDFPKLLQSFLDAKNLEHIYLGGVSLGGQIVMHYMEQDPKAKVEGLVLISTDMVKSERELKQGRKRARGVLKITGDDDRKMLCLLNNLAKYKKKHATAEDLEVMKLFMIKRPTFYREVLYTAINMKALPRLDKITVPTLIIHGDADSTIPFDGARHLVEHIPHSELKVIAGGEHSMVYTRADEVVGLIRARFAAK